LEGFLFVTVIIDLFSRRVIGWSMFFRMDNWQLTIENYFRYDFPFFIFNFMKDGMDLSLWSFQDAGGGEGSDIWIYWVFL
jgi:hypothetical protein